MMPRNDEYYMRLALQEAKRAYAEDEVPIGAIIIAQDTIIGKGYNQVERLHDATAHAEMLAITAAAHYLGAKYLEECTLYVTVEPCPMCAAALRWARIGKVVYGAADPKAGYSQFGTKLFHPKTLIQSDVLEQECGELMSSFFKAKRNG